LTLAFLGWAHRSGRESLPDRRSPLIEEGVVKELSIEEVLRIAGGVPVSAVLDELSYRAPQESAGEPVDFAHLLDAVPRAPEPK
jgi:hypothetical protein